MDDITKRKLEAATKMAWGAARIAGGVATATGHGVLGTFCNNHHQMRLAAKIATESIKRGARSFRDGLDDWNCPPTSSAAKSND